MQVRPLKNVKHELFAQRIAKGETAASAYSEVYQTPQATSETNGSRLLRTAAVRARVDYLQHQAAMLAEINLVSLMEMARVTWTQSVAENQLSAAAQALKELGILTGHRIERRENKAVRDLRVLSDDELLEIIHAEAQQRERPSIQASTQGPLIEYKDKQVQ